MNNLGLRVPADLPSDTQQHREIIAAPFLNCSDGQESPSLQDSFCLRQLSS